MPKKAKCHQFRRPSRWKKTSKAVNEKNKQQKTHVSSHTKNAYQAKGIHEDFHNYAKVNQSDVPQTSSAPTNFVDINELGNQINTQERQELEVGSNDHCYARVLQAGATKGNNAAFHSDITCIDLSSKYDSVNLDKQLNGDEAGCEVEVSFPENVICLEEGDIESTSVLPQDVSQPVLMDKVMTTAAGCALPSHLDYDQLVFLPAKEHSVSSSPLDVPGYSCPGGSLQSNCNLYEEIQPSFNSHPQTSQSDTESSPRCRVQSTPMNSLSSKVQLKTNLSSDGDVEVSTNPHSHVPDVNATLPILGQTQQEISEDVKHKMFQDCITILKSSLPKNWKAIDDEGILIMKYSSKKFAKVFQCSLHFNYNFEVTASWHGTELVKDHAFYKEVNEGDLKKSNAKELADALCKLVGQYRLYEVCTGVPQAKFKSLWHRTSDCFTDVNQFHEIRYTETCRSKSCLYAVPQLKRQCSECKKVYRRFSSRSVFKDGHLSPSGRLKTPNKFKSVANLITPEKEARLRRWKKVIFNLKKQNERLRQKLEVIVEEEGVEVDEEMDLALMESLQEADTENKLSDFHKLFLQQQIKAAKVKGPKGMRWHPLMIRFALQLKMVSSVGYATMAKSGFIKLPGIRTLFDYSNAMSIKEGIHTEIIEDVSKAVEACPYEYQRNHVLLFDEVAVCQGLAQRKSTGEVIGYCNLSNVKQELMQLEKLVEDLSAEVTPTTVKSPPLVKKMLSYMVKGTASGVQSVVASFGVYNLSKEDLHNYTWDVIGNLETSGIQVCALVCDGCPINRGFLSMQPPHSTDSDVVYDTVNVYAPERVIYFISDPPHLLKTIRNCLYNSGRKKCRDMQKGGEFLHWKSIVRLFKVKSEQTIKKLFKLTAPCVYLNSYSRMKVAYAARVISNSVAEVLLEMNWPNTTQLSIFENIQ